MAHALLRDLGPEPLDRSFDGDYLYYMTRRKRVAIKLAIMDSHSLNAQRFAKITTGIRSLLHNGNTFIGVTSSPRNSNFALSVIRNCVITERA